jgi:imidazolonepropionase
MLLLQNPLKIYGRKTLAGHSILIHDDQIIDINTAAVLEQTYHLDQQPELERIDCSGQIVLPGYIDCHTHLLFCGSREDELYMRAGGLDYLQILQKGGGIHNTVSAVQKASESQLLQNGLKFLDKAIDLGITTVEIKTGYGLDLENELKMLKVINRLKESHPVDVVPTLLLHTIPKEMQRKSYLRCVADEMLPECRRYSDWFDIFLEKGAFTFEEADFLLFRAAELGYHLGMHSNQMNDLGGVELAVRHNIRHIDHLEVLNDKDANQIKQASQLYAVFLPSAEYFCFSDQVGQIQRLGDIPERLILSSDFNPGSSPVLDPHLVMSLAVLRYRIDDPALLLNAYTKNPADMLMLEDRGRIEKGLLADLLCIDMEEFGQIPYMGTLPMIRYVIKRGKVLKKPKATLF